MKITPLLGGTKSKHQLGYCFEVNFDKTDVW